MRHYSNKLTAFLLLLTLACFSLQQGQAQAKAGADRVSVATELKAFYNISDLPAYSEGTIIGQASSYDRSGGNDDGFSGRYSFVRRRPDSSLVLLDVQGPGVIDRIWTPTPSDDSLDFYIDDTTKPAFTISYLDLFSGKVAPFVAPLCGNQLGGFYCYLPIPYQKRCLVVFRGKHTQFYQIGYRSLPPGTAVKSFTTKLNAAETAALRQVQTLWNKRTKSAKDFVTPQQASGLQMFKKAFQLLPGQTGIVMQVNKGGHIAGIELEPAAAFEGFYKNADLKITWDNEAHPAVYSPIADFFGFAFGKQSMQSLLIGSQNNKLYCYFPMPFDKSAKIEIVYRKPVAGTEAKPINISAQVYYLPQARNAQKEGKFYAHWNHKEQLPLGQPHLFLNTSGKGHYVGTTLQTRGLRPGMTGFFEGDDSTVIDGVLRVHGTGSEDYFNGGWYAMMDRWDGAFSLPLSGSLDYSLPLSRTGGYRLFITDKMPFTKSIHHSIEHGPEGNAEPGTYTSVAYYYSNTPQTTTIVPNTAETRVSMPDTMVVFPQLLTMNTTGDITIQRRWAYHTGGESMVFTSSGETGVRVHLQEVPDGDYKVYLDYVKYPQGSAFSVWQRQTPLTDWLHAYNKDTVRMEQQYFSDVTLTPLNRTITLRLKGDGAKNQFFLNRIILIKKEQ